MCSIGLFEHLPCAYESQRAVCLSDGGAEGGMTHSVDILWEAHEDALVKKRGRKKNVLGRKVQVQRQTAGRVSRGKSLVLGGRSRNIQGNDTAASLNRERHGE